MERRARRKPGVNRQLLLDAAVLQFGELGYAATKTADIARNAGVPQPHVYANFRSKAELFFLCVDTVVDALSEIGSPRELEADDRRHERFLIQMIAARHHPDLHPALGQRLVELTERLGTDRVQEAVLAGASTLLAG